jgi:hypothetical protein
MTDPRDDFGSAGPRCPRCGTGVRSEDRWNCDAACGAIWNTFRTDGICPGCGRHWSEAQCSWCGAWSTLEAWRGRGRGPVPDRDLVRPFEPIRVARRHPPVPSSKGRFIGRSEELRSALAILGRRRGGGLLVVGEEGAGRTTLVDEISRVAGSGDSRAGSLAGAVFQSLEIETFTTARGDDGLPGLREAVERASIERGTILVIEDLHRIVAADREIVELVSELSGRGVRTLATTDPEGFRAMLALVPSLESLLGPALTLPPMGPREAIVAALGAKPSIEIRHGVRIAHSAVVEAVGRCVATSRPLPGGAIDLLDAAASRMRVERQLRPDAIAASRCRRERLVLERESIASDRRSDAAARVERSIVEEQRHLVALEAKLAEELREIDALEAMRCRLGDLRLERLRRNCGIDDMVELLAEIDDLERRLPSLEADRWRREAAGETLVRSVLDGSLLRRFAVDEARQGPAATGAAPPPHRDGAEG